MADDQLYQDQSFEYDEQSEGSDDYTVSQEDFASLFIVPSDWTVATLRDQIKKGFDLDPEFQRRGVWNKAAKSRFMESLIIGIPIPQILLAADKQDKNSYIVLDGKQRLLTIQEFFDERFDDGTTFKLSGLENFIELNGKTWTDIQALPNIRRALDNATIRTAVLRGWKKDAVLYEIFYRLNSGSVKLSPMELRSALVRGPFLRHVIRWTESLSEIHSLLRLRAPDKRMNDVELAVRHLAFDDGAIEYRGNLKEFLDNYCALQNEQFSEPEIAQRLLEFNRSVGATREVFGVKAACRKWVPEKNEFDTRFNRAIFDVIVGSMANIAFREWAVENREQVVEKFVKLCESDQKFMSSVESTTKSIGATKYRFGAWFELAQDISGIEMYLPNIVDEPAN